MKLSGHTHKGRFDWAIHAVKSIIDKTIDMSYAVIARKVSATA